MKLLHVLHYVNTIIELVASLPYVNTIVALLACFILCEHYY